MHIMRQREIAAYRLMRTDPYDTIERDAWHRDMFGVTYRAYHAYCYRRQLAKQNREEFPWTLLRWSLQWRSDPGFREAQSVPAQPRVSKAGGAKSLLGVIGYDHPRSRAVSTPRGEYGSIALAAQAYGISRQAGHARVKRGTWRYAARATEQNER